jgi:hypothetical protein
MEAVMNEIVTVVNNPKHMEKNENEIKRPVQSPGTITGKRQKKPGTQSDPRKHSMYDQLSVNNPSVK